MTIRTTKTANQPAGWRLLTVQLMILIVLPLALIVLAITIGSTTLHQNAMRDLVGERDERVVQMAARAIEDQLVMRENALRGLAVQTQGFDPEQGFQSTLNRSEYLDSLFDIGIFVMDRQGELIASRGPIEGHFKIGGDLLENGEELFTEEPGSTFIVSPFQYADTGRFASAVIAVTQQQEYLLGGLFYVDDLANQSLGHALSPNQPVAAMMLDAAGRILFQQGFASDGEDVLEHAGVSNALSGETGRAYTNAHNGEHVVAYTSIDRMNWGLLIEEPWEQVASPLLEATHLAPLVMIPVMLLALFALLFAFRQIIRPLRLLADQASSLGWGDYAAIEKPVGGIEEIRYLQLELIHMAQKVQAAQRSLHSYIGAITSGQEEERRRIARELHDDTIQSLISFKQKIQLAEMDYEDQPVAEALSKLENLAEDSIDNVRRMVRALRPIYLEDLGLVTALKMLVNEIGQTAGIATDFDRQGKERRLDPAVELALYRIVQEALNNTSHHSEASHASVVVSFTPGAIRITVTDNGKGFRVPNSPAEFAPGGHFGLLGMYERTELIGGKLQVHSSPGDGTRVTIDVDTVRMSDNPEEHADSHGDHDDAVP